MVQLVALLVNLGLSLLDFVPILFFKSHSLSSQMSSRMQHRTSSPIFSSQSTLRCMPINDKSSNKMYLMQDEVLTFRCIAREEVIANGMYLGCPRWRLLE